MIASRRIRRERKRIFSDYWSTPSSQELDVVDRGDHIEVSSCCADVAGWWLGTLRAVYPQDHLSGHGDTLKMHPAMGVTLKLNKIDGTLKIKGRKHLQWFEENFKRVLTYTGMPYDAIAKLGSKLDEYLKLSDGLTVNNLLYQLPPTGAIKHGPRFVYRLWRGLINYWLSYPATVANPALPGGNELADPDSCGHVYVVSPLIDSKRLADLLLMLVKHRLSSCKMHIYTMQRCSGEDGKFERVFKDAKEMVRGLRDPQTKRRIVVEERLRKALARLDIRFGRFQTKLLAFYRDEFAELLLTSANFHSWNFVNDNHDSVCYLRLPSEDLKHSYLEPLGLVNQDGSNGAAMQLLETSSISGASELSHSLSYQPSECSSSSSMHEGFETGLKDLEGLSVTGGSSSTLNEEPLHYSTMTSTTNKTSATNTNGDGVNHYATIGSLRRSYKESHTRRGLELTGQGGGGLPDPTQGISDH